MISFGKINNIFQKISRNNHYLLKFLHTRASKKVYQKEREFQFPISNTIQNNQIKIGTAFF